MPTYTPKNSEPQRLDSVATELLALSRTKVQKAIKAGQILLNGEPVPVKALVTSEDTINVSDDVFYIPERDTSPPDLDIIFENDDVLVVNKPDGILVHDAPGNVSPTLVDGLLAHCPQMKEVGDDAARPGIVHRLDKYASGVLITAKTQAAFAHLKKQFSERLTTKKYTVLVENRMEKLEDTIDFSIERSKSTGRMAAKPRSQESGKEAISHYDVIKQFPHHSLLDVRIETGRTHQIRVHMLAIGHPVVGDTLYRLKGKTPRDIGRLFLHARELTITLPDGETTVFEAPLPAKLEQVLEDIPKL